MHSSITFREWLKKYESSDCPFGDIARDIRDDPEAQDKQTYHTLLAHLKHKGAESACLKALGNAFDTYCSE